MKPATDFNCYADSYDRALEEALAASGEDGQYFARGRVECRAACAGSVDHSLRALDVRRNYRSERVRVFSLQ
jgi:hypothetical protein